MRVLAIDFETANEVRASACAIGLAWIENGAIVRREYRTIRPPEMRFSPWNVRVHGIRPADVAHRPEFPAIMSEFKAELSGNLVLAHNAGFDVSVLRGGFARYGMELPDFRYLCTHAIARAAWPHETGFGLGALAARRGIRFTHHHAGEDAYACAEIALAAARRLGLSRIGDLADRLGLQPRPVQPVARRAIPPMPTPPTTPARRISDGSAVELTFEVSGRTGTPYRVDCFEERSGTFRLRCTCMAGQNRIRCRHVTALLDGEVADLVSDNLHDLERLRRRVLAVPPGRLRPDPTASRAREAAVPF